jgi:type III pantothenate kinase
MSRYWLVLDIGNTHTVAGLAPNPGHVRTQSHPQVPGDFLASIRFRTDHHATSDEYRLILGQLLAQKLPSFQWELLERAIVSTVVPALEPSIREALGRLTPLFVTHEAPRDFGLELPTPSSLGADRLANVAGALARFEPPFLIVDAGTATTFCLIDSRRQYIGGAIAPGLDISWKALQSRASKLFSVQLNRPLSSLGDTTETQLQSGVLLGYEALIEGLCDRLIADAASHGHFQSPKLIATGGIVNLLSLSKRFQVEPNLTLEGLMRYGQLSSGLE